MKVWELLILAVGLSMDAFAIAICKGLSVAQIRRKHLVVTGLWFGGAQAIMPLLGYGLGSGFQTVIRQVDHWIAFLLLCGIGIGMLREAREQAKPLDESFSAKVMFPLAVADSIDALAASGSNCCRRAAGTFMKTEIFIEER